ncbi:hypothetical protein DMH15_16100 [Streptomyces sp. WAC 06725]|uniref:WhiB family transcriptional regulator n=1 Tax=Streptomyces sp. WAC 06725 TaxID=2203209 RepID=UPI000F742AF7|nr:WhiB family transcriptional regulator [Streptomyces sp. WAC 06725]RSO40141.1 hypothetical protein DMH15_16100 [Streptomyces sp. WAC 06725]
MTTTPPLGRPACAADPEPFFGTTEQQRAAATVCATCPLIEACLTAALDAEERFGVWGGLTPTERHRLTHTDGTWIDDAGAVRAACGTDIGLKQHKARGEQCATCQQAHDERTASGRRARLIVEHAKGGTFYGYQLHLRLGEEACGPCTAAQARLSQRGRDTQAARLAVAS